MDEFELQSAKKMRMNVGRLRQAAQELWGRSLTEERDRRAQERAPANVSPRSLQAFKAGVTRKVLAELRAWLASR